MIAPGNYHLYLALTLGILISSGYAVGRIHQWHKDGRERDEAYRRGYETASLSVLSTMVRENPAGSPPTAHTVPRHHGRHVRSSAASADRPKAYPRRTERLRTGS
jgi:hypothetical protein